jgi:hypothetical protein
MIPDGKERLEQLHFEAQIETILRSRNQNLQPIPALEQFTKRILSFRLWGFQLELRRWLTR